MDYSVLEFVIGGIRMTSEVLLVLFLTFIIYVIGTLAYSVRVVGVKTGRIAVSFAVFNVFVLISRTANSIQAPFLTKTVELAINDGTSKELIYVFRWILFSVTLASIVGALLMPTFIKLFSKAVESFSIHRSIPRLLMHGFSKAGIKQFKSSVTKPNKENLSYLKNFKKMPKKILLLNTVAFSISTVGILSSIYAGCLMPELRSTCNSLSSVINGLATILMFVFIDPFISMLTDDVLNGECDIAYFNKCITFIVASLILGSILAQFILVPASSIIAFIAQVI